MAARPVRGAVRPLYGEPPQRSSPSIPVLGRTPNALALPLGDPAMREESSGGVHVPTTRFDEGSSTQLRTPAT